MEINGRFGVEIKDRYGNLVRKIENNNTVSNLGILQMKRWLDRNEYVKSAPDLRNWLEPVYCAGEMRRVCVLPQLTIVSCNDNESPYGNRVENAFDCVNDTWWQYWCDRDDWRVLDFKFGEPINLRGIGFNFRSDANSYYDGHKVSNMAIKTEGFTATGAGNSNYNSAEWLRYPAGTYNGYKYYKRDGAAYYCFVNVAGTKWCMSDSLGGTVQYQTTPSVLPANPWTNTWEYVSGTPNAPTVVSGTTYWRHPFCQLATDNQYSQGGSSAEYCRALSAHDTDGYYNYFDQTYGNDRYMGGMAYRMRTFEGVEGLNTSLHSVRWYGFIPHVVEVRLSVYCDDNGDETQYVGDIHFYEALMHPQNPYALKLGTDDGSILPLAASNTALGAYSSNCQWKCDAVTQPTGYTVRFSRALTGDEANDVTFKEIGLFMNADGHLPTRISEPKLANATELFARSIFSSPWSKTADQTATIYYEVTVS